MSKIKKKFKECMKPNVLIRNHLRFESIVECRILFAMFARIGRLENPEEPFSIHYSELMSESTPLRYSMIDNACKALTGKVVDLENCNEKTCSLLSLKKRASKDKKFSYANIASSITHEDGTDTIEVTFNKKIYDLFKSFYNTGEYTRFTLKYILPIKSIYSLRLYEILKQNSFKGELLIELEELKSLIGANKKLYNNYSEFKRSIIEVAKKNIEKYTDIKFNFADVYNKELMPSIKFSIFENTLLIDKSDDELLKIEDAVKKNRAVYDKKNYDEKAEHVKIVRVNFWPRDQESVLNNNSPEKIKYYWGVVEEAKKTSKIINPKNFFFKLLKDDPYNFEEISRGKMEKEEQKRKEEQAKKRLQREQERQEEEKFGKQEEIFESFKQEQKDFLLSLEPKFLTPEQKRSAAISKITLE